MRWLTFGLRVFVRPALVRCPTPIDVRTDMARASVLFRPPPFLLHLRGQSRTQPDLISVGRPREDAVILYLHGGAYLAGSPATHAAMLGRLSGLTGLRVLAPDYRLAPENPAPAAFEDALAAFQFLLDQGYCPDQIILGGDSAGGGLALALLSHLCQTGQKPLALFAFSPWTDLTLSGESIRKNASIDPLLPVDRITEAVEFVTVALAADDPRLSPLFAEFNSPPPCQLFVGSTEILLDDTLRMVAHLQSCGASVSLGLEAGAPHVWPLFDGYIPEARATLQAVARFIAAQIATRA